MILRRTSVERARHFVPRRKLLTAHSLRVKKHQTVRQTLYVPLPGLCCLFALVRAVEFVAERRDSSQTAATLENRRDLSQSVVNRRNCALPNQPVHGALPSVVCGLFGQPSYSLKIVVQKRLPGLLSVEAFSCRTHTRRKSRRPGSSWLAAASHNGVRKSLPRKRGRSGRSGPRSMPLLQGDRA